MVTRFAPIRFYRQTTLRTEAFAQSSFYAQIFLHRGLCTKKFFGTQAPLEAFTHKKHMHKMFYRQTVFTQKVLRTEVLRTEFFLITHSICEYFFTYRRFYTQMSLHRHKLHTESCAHSTRLHTANFCTERLCFPFLFTYLSCSPSQVFLPFFSLTLPTSAASSAHVVESLASKLPSINRF